MAATGQAVARTRLTAQMVLGLLFILGIVGLLYWGREALPPFFLGLIVAYMLLPLVRRVERTLPHGGIWQTMRRPIAAVIVFLGALVLVAFLLRQLAQPVIEQTAQILGSLEELWDEAQANAPGIRDWYARNVPEIARGWIDDGLPDPRSGRALAGRQCRRLDRQLHRQCPEQRRRHHRPAPLRHLFPDRRAEDHPRRSGASFRAPGPAMRWPWSTSSTASSARTRAASSSSRSSSASSPGSAIT